MEPVVPTQFSQAGMANMSPAQFHSSTLSKDWCRTVSALSALSPPLPLAFCLLCLSRGVFLKQKLPSYSIPTLAHSPLPPSLPTYYLADADFYNLHEINKCTSALLTVLHVHRFSFSPCLFPLQKIPLLFRKKESGGGREAGGGGRLTNPGVWLGLPAFFGNG